MTKFKYYRQRPKKLTAAFVQKEYTKLLERLPAAEKSDSPQQWIKLFADMNALDAYIGGEASRINYAYSKDMSDKQLEAADQYIREKLSPAISKPGHKLAEAFVNSRHREAVAKRYGQQLIPLYEMALKPLDPINIKLYVQASKLDNQYTKMIAAAAITVRGEKINLSKARSYSFSPDRSLREETYRASAAWFAQNHDALAQIYDKLVKLRTKMGQNLGYQNYLPLAYQKRGRTDYGQKDVAAFRQNVLKYFVPVYKKIAAQQAKALGIDKLKPWDINYHPDLSLPLNAAPVDGQLQQAQQAFDKLSPRLGKHFKYMREHKLIDLESRPNKQAGAYCTNFTDQGLVAVFCNSAGSADDIRTLTHEMGHAFQCWESQHIEAVDLQWGTADLAEVFSMGMEFLSLPYANEFFSAQQAQKFARYKWLDSIYTVCYVCVVDEFQHWVYKNPLAAPNQRDETWAKIFDKYLGAISFEGLEKNRAQRWYAQAHIFTVPFYYVDYALAEITAMQFGLMAAKDHKKALDLYLKLCSLGGTKSFLAALKFAKLRTPFEPKLQAELAAYASKELGLS